MRTGVLAAASLFLFGAAGCNLVHTNALSVPDSFDPEEYQQSFGTAQGTFPLVTCDPSNAASCDSASATLPQGSSFTVSCDGKSTSCTASVALELAYTVDLSSESSFPAEAIMYGIDFVSIQKVEYWIVSNTLTVGTPLIDIYVAPATAKDESGGTKLGSVGPLGAKSQACTDMIDKDGDSKANGAMICDLPLNSDGENALSNFVKDYKIDFQFIAHATVTANGGDALPAGNLDFMVRPVISIGILK